jgi:ankyrin repeat protein
MPASWTALWTSVALSRTDEVRLLLADGVEVSVKNNDGWTAMHYAALWGTEAMVDLLLECGAEVSAQTNYGLTPLHYASVVKWPSHPFLIV